MSRSQILDAQALQSDIPNTAPSGAVGIDLSISYPHQTARPTRWLVTVVVTVAPSDLLLYGLVALGAPDDATDDVWALYNDRYGRVVGGKLGTALAIGKHTFVVSDMGVYDRVYFQKSAGTVDVRIAPILESERGS